MVGGEGSACFCSGIRYINRYTNRQRKKVLEGVILNVITQPTLAMADWLWSGVRIGNKQGI